MKRAPLTPRQQMVLDTALICGGFQQRFTSSELTAFLHAGGEKDFSWREVNRIMAELARRGDFRWVCTQTYARSSAPPIAKPALQPVRQERRAP